MHYVSTGFLNNVLTGEKEAFISEIGGMDTKWLSLYPANENVGMLGANVSKKQFLGVSFKADKSRISLVLFSNIPGFTLSPLETIHLVIDEDYAEQIRISQFCAGKYTPDGYEATIDLYPGQVERLKVHHVQHIIITSQVIAQPAILIFNPTLSPIYSTELAGKQMFMEMLHKIIGAQLIITKSSQKLSK